MALFITRHALQRMFERSISEVEIENVVERGIIISEYPDDKPYPSILAYSMTRKQPLHVVYSIDDSCKDDRKYFIITVYRPSLEEWNSDYVTRRVDK